MPTPKKYSIRERIGALVLDVPRYVPRLLGSGTWIGIGNRQDRLEEASNGPGVWCDGQWSSDLHACRVFPPLGAWLMRKALAEWPIRFADVADAEGTPDMTFVIPFRGADRLPLLRTTIASILAQRDVSLECIVVEQSTRSEIAGLPTRVRHIHLPHPSDPTGWRKSWAFNVGVEAARADIVVCHDADILVPCDYGREILRRLCEQKSEVVHLQRFLFCLDTPATERMLSTTAFSPDSAPCRVRQNWQGGTLAIRKDAFTGIGGYDEQFVGWGGEDNEFYGRCMSLPGWRYGYLPFVHLWHEPQPEKNMSNHNSWSDMLARRLAIPASNRIVELA